MSLELELLVLAWDNYKKHLPEELTQKHEWVLGDIEDSIQRLLVLQEREEKESQESQESENTRLSRLSRKQIMEPPPVMEDPIRPGNEWTPPCAMVDCPNLQAKGDIYCAPCRSSIQFS